MLERSIFTLAHEISRFGFAASYRNMVAHQWKPYYELVEDQEKQLRKLIGFVFDHVPYYRSLFKKNGLRISDIKTIGDLEKLPLLTKDIIKSHWKEFIPSNLSRLNYVERATGGSTGTPFHYRLLQEDRFLGGILMYRGWGYAGYELGDRMVFLAGSSLDFGTKSSLERYMHEKMRNIKKLSSFDMAEKDIENYTRIINTFKPKFIRGYASSLYFFAKWLEDRHALFHSPQGIFTTAEKLYPHMREKIEDVFNCEVFDGYGLNDGGVSAYECTMHAGLHIDTERSIMEIVDDSGHQVGSGEGIILATSVHNYALPFIRYVTGDAGELMDTRCTCGRGYRMLSKIMGRQQEMLRTPEGKYIHGEFFTHIFWQIQKVTEFQVIQESLDRLRIKIVPEEGFDIAQLETIRTIIQKRSPAWHVQFEYVDKIDRTGAGKYKFVLNNVVT